MGGCFVPCDRIDACSGMVMKAGGCLVRDHDDIYSVLLSDGCWRCALVLCNNGDGVLCGG